MENKQLESTSRRQKAIGLFAPKMAERFGEVPPEILQMEEAELTKNITQAPTDYYLRKKFWEVANTAIETGRKDIALAEVYDGICQKSYFYQKVLQNPYKLCWITLPVEDHLTIIEEALHFGIRRMRNEIMTMPMTEKTAGHILKTIQFLADRGWGPVVQKVEQKSLQMNVTRDDLLRGDASPEDLLEKYDEIRARIAPKEVKDVEPE